MKAIISMLDAYQMYQDNPAAVKFLDCSFCMPGAGDQRRNVFENYHLPCSQFFDIDIIADKGSSLPHMLPCAEQFSKQVSDLGVSNSDCIIVYAQEHSAMAACRVWWMFRAFGHKNIYVLDGSLRRWMGDGFPTESNVNDRSVGIYEAVLDPESVVSLDELINFIGCDSVCIVDARSEDRFYGEVKEPRAGLLCGHIPQSLNLPFMSFYDSSGLFICEDKRKVLLADFFTNKSNARVISSCGSGVTACVLAVVACDSGFDNVSVYDGSWIEYGDPCNNTIVHK